MHWSTRKRVRLLKSPAWPTYVGEGLSKNAATLAPWFAGGVSLLLYMGTMVPDLTWRHYGGDGGELITASMTLGIPHPPGYPLYTLIGHLFGAIPFGVVAARYNFLSALASALVVAMVVLLLTMRSEGRAKSAPAAVASGLALALTPLFWGQALITEVYSLFLIFVALLLWAIFTGRSAFVIGLALGLAITSHLTGLLLVPLAAWHAHKSGLARFSLGIALGLSPFLLLPWLSNNGSPVSWGNVASVRGWWWLVSAELYRPNVLGLATDQFPARLAEWLVPGVLLPVLLWLVLAVMAVWQVKRVAARASVALLVTALVFILYAFAYRAQDAAVLMLPGLLLLAVIAGRWLAKIRSPAIWLLPIIMLGMSIIAFPASDEQTLRQQAASSLSLVPANAIVLTAGDATISALWYLHHVEDMRPDIIIVDQNMFQFDWYRANVAAKTRQLFVPAEDDLGLFVTTNRLSRPVCSLSLAEGGQAGCHSTHLETPVE